MEYINGTNITIDSDNDINLNDTISMGKIIIDKSSSSATATFEMKSVNSGRISLNLVDGGDLNIYDNKIQGVLCYVNKQ